MAARKSIGSLVAQIEADSSGFVKTLADTETRLIAFAKKAASPMTFALGAGAGLGGILGSPEAFLKPLSQMANVIGGGKYGDLLDPEKATKKFTEFKDQMVDLGRESRKFGMDPQHLLAFQKMAGPDAEGAMTGLNKMMLNVGSGTDEMVAKLEKWGLSWQELRANSPEQVLEKVADAYKNLDDPLDKAAMRFDLAGKSAGAMHKILEGGGAAIEDYVEKLKKLGIGTPEGIALSELINQTEKGERMKYEGYTAKAFEQYGAARMMYGQLREEHGIFDSEYWQGVFGGFGTHLDSILGTKSFIPEQRIPGFNALLGDLNKAKPTAAEIADRLAAEEEVKEMDRLAQIADDATAEIGRLNDALTEHDRLLRLTERGWDGVEKEVLAVTRAIEAGGDVWEADALLERLGERATKNRAGKEEKAVADLEKDIMSRLRGAGTGGPLYAQTALSGSQEFAHAYAGGMGDQMQNLVLTVEQILEHVKKPTVDPELARNVAEAARLLRNGDVKVLRPNP